MAAAFAQVQVGVPMGSSLVGASGAISALLGFNLLARPQVKVKLLYLVFLLVTPRYGVFDCPLWFFLPIWFLTQLFESMMVVDKAVMNTAYAAHLGGFMFGCLLGWAMASKGKRVQTPSN
jgi:membrane associated rhomboid family serine protease